VEVCPKCQRKLISHASARCNWCGEEIADSAYQAEADFKREALHAQQAMHDAKARIWFRAETADNIPFGLVPGRLTRQRVKQEEKIRAAARAKRAKEDAKPESVPETEETS
jgi:hypothetical protein